MLRVVDPAGKMYGSVLGNACKDFTNNANAVHRSRC